MFLGNWTILLPLLVKFLKFSECLYNIRALSKLLCSLAELLLCLKILLEIKVAKFAIDLHHIVKLLHIELICLIDISEALCRNRAHSSPSVLNLAELRECRIHILLLLNQALKVSNHLLLCGKVFLTLLVKLLVIIGLLLSISVIKILESFLDFCKWVL